MSLQENSAGEISRQLWLICQCRLVVLLSVKTRGRRRWRTAVMSKLGPTVMLRRPTLWMTSLGHRHRPMTLHRHVVMTATMWHHQIPSAAMSAWNLVLNHRSQSVFVTATHWCLVNITSGAFRMCERRGPRGSGGPGQSPGTRSGDKVPRWIFC